MDIVKKKLSSGLFIVGQFGFNPIKFVRSLRGVPIYLRNLILFKRIYGGSLSLKPCLLDRFEEGGSIKNEYFWQDLFVARLVFTNNPQRHVDVGSRVDGFVAHVAAFREIEVFDVRPITVEVPGVTFRQADLMNPDNLSSIPEGYCDSVSCLHALEHFGLGRYGDPINAEGFRFGIANLSSLLRKGGVLYLSVPVGAERVDFDANWIFHPKTIIDCAKDNGLGVKQMWTITGKGVNQCELDDESIHDLAKYNYKLGLFSFIKL